MVSHSRENYWLDNVLISYLGSWRLLEDESSGTNGVDRPFSQMRDGYTPSDYSDKPYPWYFPRNQADRGRTVFKNGCLSYLTWHINETYHRQHIFSLKKKCISHWSVKIRTELGAIELQKRKVWKISAGPCKVENPDVFSICTYSFWPQVTLDSLDSVLSCLESKITPKTPKNREPLFWKTYSEK